MTTTTAKLMTAEELLRLPRGSGERHELVMGELVTMSPAGFDHGRLTHRLQVLLDRHIYGNRLGEMFTAETGFIIRRDPDTVRAADTGFVSKSRLDQYGHSEQGYYPIAPDLVVEVISPNDRQDEIDTKIEEWFEGGARAVWMVSPRRKTVTVYNSLTDIKRLAINDVLLGDPVLPGFSCPLTDIFPAD